MIQVYFGFHLLVSVNLVLLQSFQRGYFWCFQDELCVYFLIIWVIFWLTAPCETEGRGTTVAVVCLVLLLLLVGGALAFLLWR